MYGCPTGSWSLNIGLNTPGVVPLRSVITTQRVSHYKEFCKFTSNKIEGLTL